MRTLTKFAALAAATISLSAVSAAANATVVFGFTGNLAAFSWTNAGTGGTLVGSGSNIALSFQDLTPAIDQLTGLSTTFSFSGTATNSPAIPPGATWTQTGLNGSFSYIYNGPDETTGDGIVLTTGENLLTGDFTNAWIQGAGGTGSTNVTLGNGGSLTYSSDVTGLTAALAAAAGPHGTGEFAYSLIGVSPNFGAGSGQALNSFRASALGSFDVVPEPASWALMILGFGGAGVVLRNNRRRAAVAA